MTTVRFGPSSGGRRTVSFPYDPDVVAIVKTIPASGRSWDPARKQWTVSDLYARELADTLQAEGYPVVGLTATPPPPPPPPRQPPPGTWAQQLFKAVGPDRAQAVHRALTKVLHPDTPTGDTRLQQQLNDAL